MAPEVTKRATRKRGRGIYVTLWARDASLGDATTYEFTELKKTPAAVYDWSIGREKYSKFPHGDWQVQMPNSEPCQGLMIPV
jgi:hypothetical protein